MTNGESAKTRASRIPLKYYKRPDNITRTKLLLVALAVIVAVGWFAFSAFSSRGMATHVSRGDLAAVHATWDTQCEACHVPFQPIVDQSWTTALNRDPRTSNQRCEQCHAGAPHHAFESPGDAPTCATCHQDHRGRDASLTRVADHRCTDCHANIHDHMREDRASESTLVNVTKFAPDAHPEWDVLRTQMEDPGRLKFNHQLHMTAGLTGVDGGKPLYRVGQLSEEDRERLGVTGAADDPVQLDCASCHTTTPPADNTVAKATFPFRGAGAYMAPVSYERNCAACHPLNFDTREPEMLAPHGKQPAEIREWLWTYYAGRYVADDKSLERKVLDVSRRPDKTPDTEALAVKAAIDERTEVAAKLLFDQKRACGECHYLDQSGDLPKIEPVAVPQVWLEAARFDHSAHRAVSCRECHPQAYPDSPDASKTHTDIMLPGVQTCMHCHAPAGKIDGRAVGGARYDCAECHWYHQAGSGQGVGHAAQDIRAKLDIDHFLGGAKKGE